MSEFGEITGSPEEIALAEKSFDNSTEALFGISNFGNEWKGNLDAEGDDEPIEKALRSAFVSAETLLRIQLKKASLDEKKPKSVIKQGVGMEEPQTAPYTRMLTDVNTAIKVLDGDNNNLETFRASVDMLSAYYLKQANTEHQAELNRAEGGFFTQLIRTYDSDKTLAYNNNVAYLNKRHNFEQVQARKITDKIKSWNK